MKYSLSLVVTLLSTTAIAGTTGSDAAGNTITGSDINDAVQSDLFFDISGTAPLLAQGDDTSAQSVLLGIVFPFYGNDYTELTLTTNGYLSTSPADRGSDLSNDGTLPGGLSSGGGARIYPHHDDLEGIVYGAYFAADENPLGTEAFIMQHDACHFNCTPGVDLTVQYNVYLLRDGTIVMAHNLAGPEAGSGATVGIQNEARDDGIAYFINEPGALMDGQTVIVMPENSGLSVDINNVVSETAAVGAAALASSVADHIGGSIGAGLATRDTTLSYSTKEHGVESSIQPWVTAGASYSTTDAGQELETRSLHVHGGADLYTTENAVAGLGLALSVGETTTGPATVETASGAIFLYGGVERFNWDFGATLSYGATMYKNLETPLMSGIDADGERVTASISATGQYDIGNGLGFAPRIAVMAGREQVDDWSAGGGISRSVEEARFVGAELSGKLSRSMDLWGDGGTGFVLAGADYLKTDGDNELALYSFDYEGERVGGMLGVGYEGEVLDGMALSASLTGTDINKDGYSIRGTLSLKF